MAECTTDHEFLFQESERSFLESDLVQQKWVTLIERTESKNEKTFRFCALVKNEQLQAALTPQVTGEATSEAGAKQGLSRDQGMILRKCLSDCAIRELMAVVGRANRTKFRDQVLNPLLEAELVEMTEPDSPKSPTQKYRLTEKGKRVLDKNDVESGTF